MIKFNDDKYLEDLDFVMMNKNTRIKKFLPIFSLLFLLLLCREEKQESKIQKVGEVKENKTTQNLNEEKIKVEEDKMKIIYQEGIELEFLSSKLVFIKWEGKEKVDSYEVSRVIDGEKELLALFPSSITFYPDGDVKPGKKYCWEVKAKSAEREEIELGKACAEISEVEQEIPPPPSPSNLKLQIIDGNSSNKIRLEWQKEEDNNNEKENKNEENKEIGFKILKNVKDKFVAIWISPSSVTSFEIVEKEEGKHCYRVISYGLGGDSGFSNEVCLDCFGVYSDNDGDGYGISEGVLICNSKFPEGITFFPEEVTFKFSGGVTTLSGDCDDKNPKINPGVFDLQDEQDGIDNDCDGKVDDDRKIQVEYICPLTFPNNYQFSSTYIYTYMTSCPTYMEARFPKELRVILRNVICETPEFKDIIYPTRVTILYYKITSENQLRCSSGDEIKVDFSKKFIFAIGLIGLYNYYWDCRGDHKLVEKIYYKNGNLYIYIQTGVYNSCEDEYPAPHYIDWDFIILEREYIDTPIIFVFKPRLYPASSYYETCLFIGPCLCLNKHRGPNIPVEEWGCDLSGIFQTQFLEK
jgi:hypothetical protein